MANNSNTIGAQCQLMFLVPIELVQNSPEGTKSGGGECRRRRALGGHAMSSMPCRRREAAQFMDFCIVCCRLNSKIFTNFDVHATGGAVSTPSKQITTTTTTTSSTKAAMSRRNHRRSKVTRVVNLVKRIIAFFFSHVGLCALVIGYAMLGAVVFRAVEGPHERYIQSEVTAARSVAVGVAWNATFRVNKLDRTEWERTVYSQTKLFKRKCLWAIHRGYDGKEFGRAAQWTFTGSFLYSLSIITTIGYGNTSAKTYFGKTLTILFAIIGIPLMLLFLTNIGDVMAKIFRFLYARSIRLKYNIILWHKRRQAAKIRRANSLVAKLTRANHPYLSTLRFQQQDDCSLESLGPGGGLAPVNGGLVTAAADVNDLLAARAHLVQLEVKESVEAQLQRISVPLSLVLLTMLAYLGTGAILFCLWEEWTFLDSFYFCYISLTTIGFGDKFPGEAVGSDREAQEKLVITSIYLLAGMALLAMCFNLAQEEVVNKVAWLANKFRAREDEYDE
uniref:Potassium channel domain-containing protein n=1 Tax=Globodera rostochiensis TaxID=31243 RepID=A0A914GVU9_GLORO